MNDRPSPQNNSNQTGQRQPKPFLGINFVNCGTYGRIYRNARGDAYVGHCPRCMHPVRVKIGPAGTGHRFFKCFCP